MIKKYFARRAEKRRTFRSLLAVTLARKLEDKGELRIDKTLSVELGATRQEILRAACDLVMQERIHISSDIDGVVRLLTNARFEQTTRESASSYRTARLDIGIENEPFTVTDPDSEALIVDDVEFEFDFVEALAEDSTTLDPIGKSSNWTKTSARAESAGFIVANGKENRVNLPEGRKTLPPRERDPWQTVDDAEYPPIKKIQ